MSSAGLDNSNHNGFVSTILFQHSIDASISEYQVETKDAKQQFGLFQSLECREMISVTVDNGHFLFGLSRELKDWDRSSSFLGNGLASSTPISISFEDDDVISFVPSEFYNLTHSELHRIPVSPLYQILSYPSLKLSSECALYF
jgi:hypothetical protein